MKHTPPTPSCVVVGDEPFAHLVERSLDTAADHIGLQHVQDGLSALGHIAQDPPTPPGLLVSSLDALGHPPEQTASALRTLGPDLTMVVVASPDHLHAAKRAVDAGFDRCVVQPLHSETLKDALGLPTDGRTAPNPDDLTPHPTTPAPTADDEQLIDLLMANHGDLTKPALELLREHTGIKDLQRAVDRDALPPNCTAVDLTYAGQALGVLWSAHPIDDQHMADAANWLSRWLALQTRLFALWDQAMRDDLTGVWNRRYFRLFLDKVLKRAAQDRFRVTLMVYDIDDFKTYNDRHGHAAGDQILKETARLMRSVVREHDVVARIGGDEFAVIFWDADNPRQPHSEHPGDALRAAQRFRDAVWSHKFPKLSSQALGRLTISGGIAGFPWDGRTPEELLHLADRMALRSKQQGKNVLTLGPRRRTRPFIPIPTRRPPRPPPLTTHTIAHLVPNPHARHPPATGANTPKPAAITPQNPVLSTIHRSLRTYNCDITLNR